VTVHLTLTLALGHATMTSSHAMATVSPDPRLPKGRGSPLPGLDPNRKSDPRNNSFTPGVTVCRRTYRGSPHLLAGAGSGLIGIVFTRV
jgi:hypothetical protein